MLLKYRECATGGTIPGCCDYLYCLTARYDDKLSCRGCTDKVSDKCSWQRVTRWPKCCDKPKSLHLACTDGTCQKTCMYRNDKCTISEDALECCDTMTCFKNQTVSELRTAFMKIMPVEMVLLETAAMISLAMMVRVRTALLLVVKLVVDLVNVIMYHAVVILDASMGGAWILLH